MARKSKGRKGKGSARTQPTKNARNEEDTEKLISDPSNSNNVSSWQALLVVVVVGIAVAAQDYFLNNNYSNDMKNKKMFMFGGESGGGPVDLMDACSSVMALSSIPDAGWGIFRLRHLLAGKAVSEGDLVVPVPDVTTLQYEAIRHLLHNYMWGADVAGGQHEGQMVHAMPAGIGVLSNNGHEGRHWNVVPKPGSQIDQAGGVTRTISPGAGAFSRYHNFTFFAHRDIRAGDEVLVDYGSAWEAEPRKIPEMTKPFRPVQWLKENGICLDHIRPGLSNLPHAGRGAFATRDLAQGTIVAPVPLVPIHGRVGVTLGNNRSSEQLLKNYCLGHKNSSVLFFPFAPTVNLINHHSTQANVELRWSQHDSLHYGKDLLEQPAAALKSQPYGLLLEFVATRDIQEGDEILLHYGQDWQEAWDRHVQQWKPPTNMDFEYPQDINDETIELRTEDELRSNPYPSHVQTLCRYKHETTHNNNYYVDVEWENHSGLRELKNIYPCKVLHRYPGNVYTVEILNKHDIASQQKKEIPVGHRVTQVPRWAIHMEFKTYASDQHLPNAFRHEIGIPNDIFPKSWMDLH